jgi:Flp pilus assembly protein TadG
MEAMDGRAAARPEERGAAVVEFAIVLPLLVMLLLGIVEFSLMYNRQQALHAAAREGGRVAALETSPNDDITSAIDAALSGTSFDSARVIAISTDRPSIDPDRPCHDNQGATVTVTVSANSAVDIPFWNNITVGLTGKAAFRCE